MLSKKYLPISLFGKQKVSKKQKVSTYKHVWSIIGKRPVTGHLACVVLGYNVVYSTWLMRDCMLKTTVNALYVYIGYWQACAILET